MDVFMGLLIATLLAVASITLFIMVLLVSDVLRSLPISTKNNLADAPGRNLLGNLSTLPAEVRVLIYEYVFSEELSFLAYIHNFAFCGYHMVYTTCEQAIRNKKVIERYLAVCNASPQLASEAKPVFFATTTLKIRLMLGRASGRAHASSRIPRFLPYVRDLVIERRHYRGRTTAASQVHMKSCEMDKQSIRIQLRGEGEATEYRVAADMHTVMTEQSGEIWMEDRGPETRRGVEMFLDDQGLQDRLTWTLVVGLASEFGRYSVEDEFWM